MMKNKKVVIIVVALLCSAFLYLWFYSGRPDTKNTKYIKPAKEDIILAVVSTGLIQPQNRLEIKPSIGGRIEDILVREGDKVKVGQVLARMSSTERAALIDAARLESEEVLAYWQDVYKKSPIISPIDGEVIARNVEPGQTVTVSDAILVLSDRLVVKAQFDETDIGRVRIGQDAVIVLDAYPDIRLTGIVDHIAYESEIINNVTIYNVDILIEEMPRILRSGMSVTVELIEKRSEAVMTLPLSAVYTDNKRNFVMVRDKSGKAVEKDIVLGILSDNKAEILSGLNSDDSVIFQDTSVLPARKSLGANPFMPGARKR
jgi:membrane fusion protein, macrolide-specific efflux system